MQDQKASDRKASMRKYSFNAELSKDDLAKMITIHDYPLSIVEHYGFRKYSEGLQPLFRVPCRATTESDIIKIYETQSGYTLRCLEENESRIVLTSDTWTSSNQMKCYMEITTHYIDANWSLQNRIIR